MSIEMLILRKIISAVCAAFILSMLMAWLMKDAWGAGMLSWLLIVPIYAFPVMLLYGLPVSLLSEVIAETIYAINY